MNNKFIILLMVLVVSLLTGCASVPMPTQEGSLPPQMKSVDYYKTHLNEVIKKAESGDVDAQIELTFAYGNTWYGVQDLDKHLYWLEKAADQNNLPALCALSAKYYKGFGRISADVNVADSIVDRAYNIYFSKPKSAWSMYDTYMMSGALMNKGVYATTKEKAKQYLCLAKNMGVVDENRIYMINKRIHEKGVTCN